MSKKNLCKKVIGICLVAMMAVGSIGRYAEAKTFYVRDNDGNFHYAEAVSSINQTSGSARTVSKGTPYCHCSVSATFSWFSDNEWKTRVYSNGGNAGGMHGAEVTMRLIGNTEPVRSTKVSATHTIYEIYTDNSEDTDTGESHVY